MNRKLSVIVIVLFLFGMVVGAQDETTPIDYGETASGSLSDDAPSEFYTFDATAGDNVLIDLQSDDFDTYLYLLNEDGGEVTRNDDGGSGLNSRIQGFEIPEDGTYTIQVTSYSNATRSEASAGDYTLLLDFMEVTPIEFGQVIEGDSEGFIGLFDFTAEADTPVSIQLQVEDFDSELVLFGPEGFEIARGSYVDGTVTRISPYIIEEPGTYQISASGTGEYSLTFDSVEITPLEIGSSVTASFTEDTNQLYFSFDGTRGEILDIVADSGNTLDTRLSLISPFNYEAASNEDAPGSVDPALTSYNLNDEGTYIISLTAQNPNANLVGDVTLSIGEAELATLGEEPLTLEFDNNVSEQIVTFEATAGEVVRLIVEPQLANEFSSPSVFLEQDGTTVANLNLNGVVRLAADIEIDMAGTVNVRVSSYDTSDITITLERLSAE